MSDDVEPDAVAVFFRDRDAGRLYKRPDGYLFRYNPAYLASPGAHAISLNLPLRADDYRSYKLFPFFDGLIPEGWLLDLALEQLRIDRTDRFRLLLHMGREAVGAVTVRPLKKGTDEPA